MFSHYIKLTLRHFYREKAYALINVVGLALAIACSLILALYIRSELTYDQHHLNHENIYRVANIFTANGKEDSFAATSMALGPLFIKEYPQAGEFVRFRAVQRGVWRDENTELYWDDVQMADPNVFDVFTHHAVFGDLSTALEDPKSIAISQSFARKYFGEANPVGETIDSDTFSFRVAAVFEDLPDNSHLKYSALLSMRLMESFGQDDSAATPQQLFGVGIYTYLMPPPDFDGSQLQRLLDEFYDKFMSERGNQIGLTAVFLTQPLADVHFDARLGYDEPTGNIFYVYGFFAVALFVILVACINYTNLATARATKRAKEIGMRKIIGATRGQLMMQFMGESVLYALAALALGLSFVVLAEQFTPLTSLLNKSSLLNFGQEPLVLVWVVVGTLIVGLMAGVYPALYLSSIEPLMALTSTKASRSGRFQLRQILIFIQFLVSVGVLASTLLMGIQMQYVASKPIGFDRENKLAVVLRGVDTLEKIPVIKNELLKNTNILGFSLTSFVPGQPGPINLMQVENNRGQMEATSLNHFAVGQEFIDVMGIEIIEGRDFSKRLLTDIGMSVVVNETLVKAMGWEQPLGKRIQNFNARVVGVMRDFHFRSLHEPVAPMFLRPFPEANYANVPPIQRPQVERSIVLSVASEDLFQTINYIDSVFTQFDPKHPFEFRFFDDLLNELYENDSNLMQLTAAFAGICIFIACLGLYGVAAFTTEQRTKEIGIRKVLGATTTQIVLMLAKNLMILVVFASIVASAISYYVMTQWLSVFAYRVDIQFWIFVVASLAVAAIAFLTVALQSSRTAQSNPVDALRYE